MNRSLTAVESWFMRLIEHGFLPVVFLFFRYITGGGKDDVIAEKELKNLFIQVHNICEGPPHEEILAYFKDILYEEGQVWRQFLEDYEHYQP